MNWGNYIKRTAVRRVVWIVAGLLVYAALSVFGVAHAQQACGSSSQCDKGEAYAAAVALSQNGYCSPGSPGNAHAVPNPGSPNSSWMGQYDCDGDGIFRNGGITYYYGCPADSEWNDAVKLCHTGCTASGNVDRPPFAPAGVLVPNGTAQCAADGCVNLYHQNDFGGWLGTPTGDFCQPNAPPDCEAGILGALGYTDSVAGCSPPPMECQPGQTQDPLTGECQSSCPAGQILNSRNECTAEQDTCPVGQIRSPAGTCLAGEGSCAAGEARGADGTCKRDSDGDGTPDEEEEEGDSENKDGSKFSGGDDCRVAPTCSGDPIMCGQARIQWRIDCNTRKNVNIAGGSCAAMPSCSGEKCDALEMAQLMQQWKTACALEKLAGAGDGNVGGGDLSGVESRLDGISSFLTGDGNCAATPEGCGDGDTDGLWDGEGEGVEWDEWQSGLASTGSCPAPINTTVSIAGYSTEISFSYQPVCDFAALMRWVLIAAATIMSGFIVAGVRNS